MSHAWDAHLFVAYLVSFTSFLAFLKHLLVILFLISLLVRNLLDYIEEVI